MSSGVYLFGTRTGRLSAAEVARCKRVASKHGATFVYADLPDGLKSWFSAPNDGAPFDEQLARAVLAELGLPRHQ